MTCWRSGASGRSRSPAVDSMPATFLLRRPPTRPFRSYLGSLLDRLGDDLGVISSAERGVDLLAGLNPPQRAAVTAGDGPLLIFAGAGSGKTRVLTHRIAWLIQQGRAEPGEILAVTFTNKAAREMRGRVEHLLNLTAGGIWMGTFHAIAVRMLRRDGTADGIDRHFVIYDEADRLFLFLPGRDADAPRLEQRLASHPP